MRCLAERKKIEILRSSSTDLLQSNRLSLRMTGSFDNFSNLRHPERSEGSEANGVGINPSPQSSPQGEEEFLTQPISASLAGAFGQRFRNKFGMTINHNKLHHPKQSEKFHCDIMQKSAFTLAEVLITLGIIGVVAAMTIPTLIANTRSHQYRSSFKKAVATLSQAAKMSQAQYGFDYATISERCGANAGAENPEDVQTVCALLNGTLTGATFYENPASLKLKNGDNYSIVRGPGMASLGGVTVDDFRAYSLSDGTLVLVYKTFGDFPCTLEIGQSIGDAYSNSVNMRRCVGLIDVNGISPPNKEVSCSSGSDSLSQNTCIVKNDPKHLTDVYPIRFHDQTVEPASAAARYVLRN